jgi:hypothetical protein
MDGGDRVHTDRQPGRIVEFVGVYDADATLWGELSYWVGARLGRRHCALCDITHSMFTRRAEWSACAERLGVPFTTHHRSDAPDDVRHAAAGRYPVVLAREGSGGVVVVLDAEALEALGGDPQRLADALESLI